MIYQFKNEIFLIRSHHCHQIFNVFFFFFFFCSLEPTSCQRPNKPLRRFSQSKDFCTKKICRPWFCVSRRYCRSSQSHWRNWSACSVKRRRPWSSRNNSNSSMGRKTSSVIIPNPQRTSDVVIYKYILRLIVSFICEKDIFSDYSYFMEKWQCIDWFNIYICVIEKCFFLLLWHYGFVLRVILCLMKLMDSINEVKFYEWNVKNREIRIWLCACVLFT